MSDNKPMKKTSHVDRRSFLKGLLAAPIVATPLASSFAAGKSTRYTAEEAKDFHSYLYDQTNCIGCKACVNNCVTVNTLPQALKLSSEQQAAWQTSAEKVRAQVGQPEAKLSTSTPSSLSREVALTEINVYQVETRRGNDRDIKGYYVKEQCMHCLYPSCVSACPVTAMTKDPKTGVISTDHDKCIGCRYCMIACPYSIIKYEWSKPAPKIRKCTMCKDTNMKDGTGRPACVSACPGGALVSGTRSQMLRVAQNRIKNSPGKYLDDKVYGETEGGGTSVFILADAQTKKFTNIHLPDPKGFQTSPAQTTEKIQSIYSYGIAPLVAYAGLAITVFLNHKKEGGH